MNDYDQGYADGRREARAVMRNTINQLTDNNVGHPMLGIDKDRTAGYQMALDDIKEMVGL